jgi:flagellar hook-basal body complex protein FliE
VPRVNINPNIRRMNTIDVNGVLAQIRALSAQAQGAPQKAQVQQSSNSSGGFGTLVRNSVDQVNGLQQQASTLQNKFEMGDPNTDLSSVMLATSKAQVSFRAMVEVRNRLVNAYQEIMNMPI